MLSALLLTGKSATVDNELDALFQSKKRTLEDPPQPTPKRHKQESKQPRRKERELSVPPSDAQEDSRKDARTIFISNLPIAVAQKKSNVKQLHRHILSLVPTAKIESSRFRSVPFNTPTTRPDPRPHTAARTESWRDTQGNGAEPKKKYLTSTADSVNAYVVFAFPPFRPPNLPPLEVLDPFKSAIQAVEKCNGTLFMDRIIHVDLADKSLGDAISDPKSSIFVGNLDFATREDDLRLFFEGIISAERGPSQQHTGNSWVNRVRIVRDKDTQLGKGFAYIELQDHQCVDELLSLEPGKLKFAKRKLRVERCKALPSSKSNDEKGVIPSGDPSLGAKLVHLSKDERKKIKSSDADRLARRLAKKKARRALDVSAKSLRNSKDKDKGKQRAKVRK